jgi:hypothetical protein
MPEFISMNFMMAGMAPVMSFLMMGRDMRATDPQSGCLMKSKLHRPSEFRLGLSGLWRGKRRNPTHGLA